MLPVDILILSNGPGEVTTWVRPVVQALRQQFGSDRTQCRISVILSPCPNATGQEAAIAQNYPEVDRVQGANHFWRFLLWGKTVQHWDWRQKGAVVFLGGDQIFPVVIGWRLRYHKIIYAEWEARWGRWIDAFGVMKPEVVTTLPRRYRHKATVVGDLMADVTAPSNVASNPKQVLNPETQWIALLPGSKPAKLAQGVPLCLAIAHQIHLQRPKTRFILPMAPTLAIETLLRFGDRRHNPFVQTFHPPPVALEPDHPSAVQGLQLRTQNGLIIDLITQFPAYEFLAQTQLALTTVGANTAELGALAVPMVVLLPTQQLDAMRAWDGLPGILANLPGLGSLFAKAMNRHILKQNRLFAWPNIWAKTAIVPELVGELQAIDIAQQVLDLLAHPTKLQHMRDRLRQVRGQPNAAEHLAHLIAQQFMP